MTERFTCGQVSRRTGARRRSCLQQAGCGPAGANLGFLYPTDNVASDLAGILAHFRTDTGILYWTGTLEKR